MQHLAHFWPLVIAYAVLCVLAFLVSDVVARWQYGVWPAEALAAHRRHRTALERIARAQLTPEVTACASEAQWLRSIARTALDPHRSGEFAAAGLDPALSAAMSLQHQPTAGAARAPREERPPAGDV